MSFSYVAPRSTLQKSSKLKLLLLPFLEQPITSYLNYALSLNYHVEKLSKHKYPPTAHIGPRIAVKPGSHMSYMQ